MSSPSTTASSIPTTPTTPFSLPSPLPNLDAMNSSMKPSHSMPHLALPPSVVSRPRRIALLPSFKLQAPPASLRSRATIIEEPEEEGCDKLEIRVPTIVMSTPKLPEPSRPKLAPLAISNVAPPTPAAVMSPSATRPNKTFADAVAGRNPPAIASSSTMTFGQLSGQPRSTKAGARTHRRAQSISMSVSDSAFVRRTDAQEALMAPRRPSSLVPSPRMVHFAPIPETESDHPRARAAHPRVSALAPPHPGLKSFGLAPPPRFQSREESTPRTFNSGRIIALPSFEDDAFASMKESSYAFASTAIAVGRGFDQWGQ